MSEFTKTVLMKNLQFDVLICFPNTALQSFTISNYYHGLLTANQRDYYET